MERTKAWQYWPQAEFIWRGAWNDPLLKWRGRLYNCYEIEDSIWEIYQEEAAEEGLEPTEGGFDNWCRDNEGVILEMFKACKPWSVKEED